MYVYNGGIIEYFNGLISLRDYLFLLEKYKNDEVELDRFFIKEKDLQNFLTKSFMSVYLYAELWDGTISDGNICIGAIPSHRVGQNPFKMVAFRQSTDGYSFIVSEYKLSDHQQLSIMNPQVDILQALELAIELSTNLFIKYKIKSDTNLKESSNIVQKVSHNIEVKPIDQISTIDPVPEGTMLDMKDFRLV